MSNLDASVNNTPYNEEELDHFKELLAEEEKDTKEEISALKKSLENLQGNQSDENSAAAHHQGDIASQEDEREKYLIMIEKQNEKLEEINAAFSRIENGTYGVCETTGKKIQQERLEAIPHTRYSVEAQKTDEA